MREGGIEGEGYRAVASKTSGRLLGVPISSDPITELQSAALSAVAERKQAFVFACANPHSLVIARKDFQFREALQSASVVVADGAGCQLGAALAGVKIGPRITGMDFFLATMGALNRDGRRVFFFGSNERVLSLLADRVRRDFPRISVGSLSPPYRSWTAIENQEMVTQIKGFAPDVLWVGMTAPKQEKWVAENVENLSIPIVGSIGAVFDYYAGTTKRAPRWLCNLGLEWLYRLPREPRRLWQRTVLSAPIFLWYSCLERLRR